MKAAFFLILLAVCSFAHASVKNGAGLEPASQGAGLDHQALVEMVVGNVVPYGAVLVGTANATNQLGSTTFALPIQLRNQERIELRAALHVNQQIALPDYGVSSNPGAYHMDVDLISANLKSNRSSIRLDFRPALAHTTPARVATRIVVYDAPVQLASGAGRLVATVQQRAIPESRLWKTTATYITFVRN